MDISININHTHLNIRVAVLAKIGNDFIFEYDKSGFYFPIGGRIKIAETSYDAANREINEEINYDIVDHKIIGTIENFFLYDSQDYHEICFVYKAIINPHHVLPKGFFRINIDELANVDIRPSVIKQMAKNIDSQIYHFILSDAPEPVINDDSTSQPSHPSAR